jgi:phage gp45-like
MHRATPANTSFRAYTSGGARSCVNAADDGHFMQEMGGNVMKDESRTAVESPQNYGFTSVVMDADKGQDGSVTGCAEAFMTFCGGNRSFPVAGVMDDRRHRLMNLQKGDVAMFRTRQDSQQFHLTGDGGFWSAPTQKTVRMQLVDPQQQQQGGGQGGAQTRDGTGGAGAGTGAGGGGQQQNGQQAVYKNGQNSYRFVDVTQSATRLSGNESHMMLSDGDSYVHCTSKKTYLGGNASKHTFSKVLTEDGPADNVYGRISSRAATTKRSLPLTRAALPAMALVLGLSLGVNYSLIVGSDRHATLLASRACMVASAR